MRRDTRKQPWQTFPFWFLILSGLAMTVAWKLDLLRPQSSEVATEEEPSTEEQLTPDWASEVEAVAETVADQSLDLTEEPAESVAEEESPRSFPETTDSETNESVESTESDPSTVASLPEQSEPTAQAAAAEPPTTKSKNRGNPFAKTDQLPHSADGRGASRSMTSSKSTARADSPFGPSQVEIRGNRRNNSGLVAAETADPPASNEVAASQDGIIQTAAIDSGANPSVPATPNSREKSLSDHADDSPTYDFSDIDRLIADGEDVEANFQLSNLYWKRHDLRSQISERLRMVSYRIYFAPQPHYMEGHVVKSGEMLQQIAKSYDVSWEYLAKLNRTDPKKIRPGQKLKVIRGPFSAVVDLSDMEMTIHSHGHFVHAFPVGIGKDGSSPIGTFKVQDKLRDPTYYGPEGVIEHNDPQNPLGEYWLDLGDSYGIHGTIDESSIGKAASHGCIRLNNRDIADVYDLLTLSSEVQIRR